MSTFLEMQTNIEDYLDRTDLNPQVQKAINRAIKKYSSKRFWFTEAESDFTTTQGQWVYNTTDIPDDIREIYYMRITVNNVYYQVFPRSQEYVVNANVNNNQGQPVDYAWFNKEISFYPVPQDEYEIKLYYFKEYDELTLPTDTNDFTTIPEAEELIENEALRWLYKKIILDMPMANEYKQAAFEAKKILDEITEGLTGMNGAIQATTW